jgi:RNA polymerase primary sigma factor
MRIAQDPLSLDSPVGEEDDSNLGDFIEDSGAEAPAEVATRKMLAEAVSEALGELSEREQEIVRLPLRPRRRQARTLEEVGREFGVTRERIRQIEAKTLAKLRHPQRSQKLKEFLVLSDGGPVHVRPIEPGDGARLVAFHARLSPASTTASSRPSRA